MLKEDFIAYQTDWGLTNAQMGNYLRMTESQIEKYRKGSQEVSARSALIIRLREQNFKLEAELAEMDSRLTELANLAQLKAQLKEDFEKLDEELDEETLEREAADGDLATLGPKLEAELDKLEND